MGFEALSAVDDFFRLVSAVNQSLCRYVTVTKVPFYLTFVLMKSFEFDFI